ncbi:hypothetical protein FRB99_006062 [Tulasnella sp. 403]|nr:hypothetical protein FRB99_006062 [Tulasnella sp. 403]
MHSKLAYAALACYAFVPAFAAPANPVDIALVKQQFVNALLTPSVVPVFNPVALLNVTFPSTGPITTGQAVSQEASGAEPTLAIIGTDASFATGGFNNTVKYTVIMIDGDVAGATNPNGVNTHYLQNDLTYGTLQNDVLSLTNTTEAVIKYAGPGPASGSGPHRYTLLVFAQPQSFAAPATPAAGSSVTMIDFPGYLKSANLGNPLAGNYFTVEVGTSTVTVSSTTAVNPATLAVPSASGSSAATGSASKSATATGSAASSSSTANAAVGAVKVSHGLALGVVSLIAGAFFF